MIPKTKQPDSEVIELRARLAEAEETIAAIRQGAVDALVVDGPKGDQVFTLQGAEKPYRLLIEAINEGALILQHDGTILFCNRRFGEMVVAPSEKIIGCSLYQFIPADQRDGLRRLLACLPPGGAKDEFKLVHAGHKKAGLPVQLSLAELEIDGLKSIGLVATDLTERKKQEQVLRDLNDELEQRVARRTAQLSRANDELSRAQNQLQLDARDLEEKVRLRTGELQQSLQSMEELCYTIAHDLRAPLRAMSGFTDALLSDFLPGLPPQAQEYLRRISIASHRMDDLIRDLLAYGRINSADLPLGPVSPAPLVEEFIRTLEDDNATIRVESPVPRVLGNSIALKQIFTNLLSNAIKFVPPGTRPEVRIFAEPQPDGWVRLCIQDNGIGIAPEFYNRIFRPFERLSAKYSGTGIGLAIVRKGIERLGGRVGVQSAPGKGSCFWIELKEARQPSNPQPQPDSSPVSSETAKTSAFSGLVSE